MPARALVQRFAFLFLILAAFGLMLLGKAETLLVERVRAGAVDVVSPILSILSRPAATVADMVESVRRLAEVHSENRRLRAQNERLLRWHEAARTLAAENNGMRNLLKYVPEPRAQFATARVIANSGGVFVRTVLVNAGTRDGIAKDQAVVTGDGLAGRIASVGDISARALLITDLNSRIPVLVERTRARAILAGDNRDRPRLEFVNPKGEVSPGDRIVTSGHGGIFPAGLQVGVVVSVSDGGGRVRPFVRLDRMEYVRIVDYKIPDVSAPAVMQLPPEAAL